MRTLKSFSILIMPFVLLSCGSTKKVGPEKGFYREYRVLNIGEIDTKEAKLRLGNPDKVYYLSKENQIIKKSNKEQWIYESKNFSRLYLYFEGGVLVSKSLNVSEKGMASSVSRLLVDIKADWKVIKEPMSNPHAGPMDCYLEDLPRGRRVKVHGYKKIVEEISEWVPVKSIDSIKEHLYKKVGKEFCIAGHCSRVTDSKAWGHNHCEWLEKLVAENNRSVRKKRKKGQKIK